MITNFNKTGIVTVVGLLMLFAFPSFVASAYTQSSVSSLINVPGSPLASMGNPSPFAGYIVLPNASNNYDVNAAYGFFVQPLVTCDPSALHSQGVAFSVSLINQSGPVAFSTTYALCKKGASTPLYFGFVGNKVTKIAILPGDVYAASVSFSSGVFYMTLTNLSTNQSDYARESLGNPGTLAGGMFAIHPRPVYEAQFSRISFAGYVTINGTTMGLGSFPSSMASVLKGKLTNAKGNIVEAVPSALSNDGTDFSVAWKHA